MLKNCFLILMYVYLRIPQFTSIWKDIIFNPRSLNPNFTGTYVKFIMYVYVILYMYMFILLTHNDACMYVYI